ncbi:hypothetical protein ACFFGH_17160 [Lysobacter korlensis]|uniref:Secreted protein n=1 Tax=Lysobacter korlensis TaxID=553636 RepID=A0ABV6RUF4_9GAMM
MVLAAALPSLVSAKEPLHVAPKLEVAPGVQINEGLSDCPFRETFGEMLKLALHKENGMFAPGKVPTSAGRSLQVRLVGFSLTGNGFLGHDTQLQFEGALYQDGKKVAGFTDSVRFQTDTMITVCAQLRSNLDAEAIQIAKWVRKPVDGQELKRWGE